MARKRKGLPIHGWLNIDKPAGMTSSTVVGKVRHLIGAAKAGHGGTLDPLATGILPIALGEATKTVSYVMDGTKTYRFTLRFGAATTTDDAEGEVIAESHVRPSDDELSAAFEAFVGEIQQVPPAFSAIKVDGHRAYELARKEVDFELAARTVRVDSLRLIDRPDADNAIIEAVSGKGVYIRSLARDIAARLGSVGHVAALRRTAVGPFTEATSISLDKLETLGHSAADSEVLLAIETVLDDIPALALTMQEAHRLKHGQAIPVLPVANRSPFRNVCQGDLVCAMAEGKLVALAKIAGGEIRPVRVLNL